MTAACERAGVGRTTVYEWRAVDADFAERWAAIDEAWVDRAERELYRRAVEGNLDPVYQGGELVGHVRRYSDALLALYLKAKRREVYGERVAVETSAVVDPAELEAAAAELERRILEARPVVGPVEVAALEAPA